MRTLLTALLLSTPALAAETDVFHGWSKDGSYFAYQSHGINDLVELFFCQTDSGVKPSWPKELDEADRIDEHNRSCVRFMDGNKAPYQWEKALTLPAPATKLGGLSVHPELMTDGESPGIVLEGGGKTQTCYVSGLREDSKLGKVWWHGSSKWLAAMVDGVFQHCAITLKGGKAAPAPKPGKKK